MALNTPEENAKELQWEEDRRQDNTERATCGAAAIYAHQTTKNGPYAKKDEADFRDLLSDLMHYAVNQKLDFETELRIARDNFEAEL